MSRWPWIMTILSGIVILNPFSLLFLASLIGYAPDRLAGLAVPVGGLLVFLGITEWLIRTEIANARLRRP